MNNLLERVSKAISGGMYGEEQWALEHARNAITAICDEIDEGGVDKGFGAVMDYTMSPVDDTLPKVEAAKVAVRKAIQAYLQHIKSTTETKGAV